MRPRDYTWRSLLTWPTIALNGLRLLQAGLDDPKEGENQGFGRMISCGFTDLPIRITEVGEQQQTKIRLRFRQPHDLANLGTSGNSAYRMFLSF